MRNNILRSSSNDRETNADTAESSTSEDPAAKTTAVDDSSVQEAFHRSRLYSLVSLALDRPTDEHRRLMDDDVFFDHLSESATMYGGPDVRQAVEDVTDRFERVSEHRREWASLFGIEKGVTVSPYELTYLPGPLMTTVRKLADIKGFYRAYDLRIADSERDRGDHIVFQTEYLGHLSLLEANLRDNGDGEGVHIVTQTRKEFVEDHLGRWYWRFTEEVSKHDEDGFYASIAALLATILEHEIELLDADPDWVPDDPAVIEWNEGAFGDSGRDCGGCGGTPGGSESDQSIDPELLDQFGPPTKKELPNPDEYGPLNSRTETDDSGI